MKAAQWNAAIVIGAMCWLVALPIKSRQKTRAKVCRVWVEKYRSAEPVEARVKVLTSFIDWEAPFDRLRATVKFQQYAPKQLSFGG
jgi:hypothetical protein